MPCKLQSRVVTKLNILWLLKKNMPNVPTIEKDKMKKGKSRPKNLEVKLFAMIKAKNLMKNHNLDDDGFCSLNQVIHSACKF